MKAGFLSWVRVNDKEIIDKLEQQSASLLKGTSALLELISDNIADRKAKIKDLEHEANRITHDLYHGARQDLCNSSRS